MDDSCKSADFENQELTSQSLPLSLEQTIEISNRRRKKQRKLDKKNTTADEQKKVETSKKF